MRATPLRHSIPGKSPIGSPSTSTSAASNMRSSTSFIRAPGPSDVRLWDDLQRRPDLPLFTQGMVLKDGAKMSKNKGNVVSVDEVFDRLGSDTGRTFALFAVPPEKDMDWTDAGADGRVPVPSRVYRFFTRNLERAAAAGGLRRDGRRPSRTPKAAPVVRRSPRISSPDGTSTPPSPR